MTSTDRIPPKARVSESLLAVRDLTIRYGQALTPAVAGASFSLAPGESLGIFGKSGSGKTTLARSLLRLGSHEAEVTSGSIRFRETEILALRPSGLQSIRGRDIAFVSQEPELALNPVLTVGQQIMEVRRAHIRGTMREHRQEARLMLAKVRLDDSATFHAYPHQLSGGQRQRVVIAQSLICRPALLIADELTSALDGRNQAEIVELLRRLRDELNLSLILISHNLELLRGATGRLASMSDGRLAENSSPEEIRSSSSRPVAKTTAPRQVWTEELSEDHVHRTEPVIEVRRLYKSYSRGSAIAFGRDRVTALAGVDFRLLRGETVALVGQSGSGKTTLGRCMARLDDPDSGEIRFQGQDVTHLSGQQLTPMRRRIQLVFQHSATAMNPHLSAEEIVGEPLFIIRKGLKQERQERVQHWMEQVGLPAQWATRRSSQFSGGQRQRLAIARAMVLDPDVVIFDEAFAGLDPATRADILDLILKLKATRPKSYVFITHDLQMAKELTDSIVVMQDGKITESNICSNSCLGRPDTGQRTPNLSV